MTSDHVSVSDATQAAAVAHRAVSQRPHTDRAAWLEALADALDAHSSELVALADDETHLGEARLTGELARTSAQLRMFADVVREGSFLEAAVDHPDPNATPPIPDLRRMLVSLGPVAVFAASDFPFAFSVLGGDTASALAAGSTVVVKAHEGHPELSRRVSSLAHTALQTEGAPDGTFTMVEGRETGVDLVRDPKIRAVGFTGSVSGGRFLFDVATQRPEPIPFYAEMGSINPVVVTPGAAAHALGEVADGLVGSFTLGVGQFCTKPGVTFAPAEAGLAAALGERVDLQPKALLNDRIGAGYRHRLNEITDLDGVEVVRGSEPSEDSHAAPVVLRTTAVRVLEQPEDLLDEVFGPAALVVDYSSLDELRQALAVLPGTLTATLHAAPEEEALAAELLDVLGRVAGRVLYGGWPTGVAVSHAQHHGGPYPSTTSVHTSVGTTAIRRWMRPVAYQTTPDALLPLPLQEANPLGIPRRVDGVLRPPSS